MSLFVALAFLHSANVRMDLAQAVERARDSSASIRIASERIQEERWNRNELVSHLLPRVGFEATQLTQSSNMATFGLTLPHTDPYVPFYSVQDLRATASVPVFRPTLWRRLEESRANSATRALDRESARSAASLQGGLAWIDAARAQALIADREEGLRTARALLQITFDQKSAGNANRLDVVRAQAQELQAERALSQARLSLEKALSSLLRATGLAATDRVELASTLPMQPEEKFPQTSSHAPATVRAASAARDAAALGQQVAKAEMLPTIDVFGDYGYIGTHLQDDGLWTGKVGIRASWNLFEGGGREARMEKAAVRERIAAANQREAKAAADQEERDALTSVKETGEQLRLAMAASALADTELVLSQEKFKAGASGNAEVVQAQASRTQAHAAWIDAASAHQATLLKLRWARDNWEGI